MVSYLQKIILAAALMLTTTVAAQAQRLLHGNCLPDVGQTMSPGLDGQGIPARPNRLSLMSNWDSTRVYPVAVILVSFSDCDFLEDSTPERYDRIFNEEGYNEGKGPGCVADYFRTQSGGLFKPHFDIYGPVKVAANAKSTSNTNYGKDIFREATKLLLDSLDIDISVYDWDGNGRAESFVYVYAGYGGNESVDVCTGSIWPNTSTFPSIAVNGTIVNSYSASPERWGNDKLCGIGTICHEYSHTLGLPDIYPTASGAGYSVCDEWDLMDGGNFINNGWCPCNYSALEKMLLGWGKPVELTDPAQISEMKPISEGGEFYRVSCSDNEYYLLENRQWSGWDLRAPGHGLLIAHVDYQANRWSSNTVNNLKDHRCYSFISADGLDYDAWDAIIGNNNPRVEGHSRILSTSPYPYVAEDIENRELTDTSEPAATVYSNEGLMGKPITDIHENEEGLVSFNFMWDDLSTIYWTPEYMLTDSAKQRVYDLHGRRAGSTAKLVIMGGKKYVHRRSDK